MHSPVHTGGYKAVACQAHTHGDRGTSPHHPVLIRGRCALHLTIYLPVRKRLGQYESHKYVIGTDLDIAALSHLGPR